MIIMEKANKQNEAMKITGIQHTERTTITVYA